MHAVVTAAATLCRSMCGTRDTVDCRVARSTLLPLADPGPTLDERVARSPHLFGRRHQQYQDHQGQQHCADRPKVAHAVAEPAMKVTKRGSEAGAAQGAIGPSQCAAQYAVSRPKYLRIRRDCKSADEATAWVTAWLGSGNGFRNPLQRIRVRLELTEFRSGGG